MWHFSRGLGGTLFACSSSTPPSLSSSRWTTSQGWRFLIFLSSFSCKCPFSFQMGSGSWAAEEEERKCNSRCENIFNLKSLLVQPNHNVLKVSTSGDHFFRTCLQSNHWTYITFLGTKWKIRILSFQWYLTIQYGSNGLVMALVQSFWRSENGNTVND